MGKHYHIYTRYEEEYYCPVCGNKIYEKVSGYSTAPFGGGGPFYNDKFEKHFLNEIVNGKRCQYCNTKYIDLLDIDKIKERQKKFLKWHIFYSYEKNIKEKFEYWPIFLNKINDELKRNGMTIDQIVNKNKK